MNTTTLPIFIRHEIVGIGSIHFPGEQEYEALKQLIESTAREMFISFEQACMVLGYELGVAADYFI